MKGGKTRHVLWSQNWIHSVDMAGKKERKIKNDVWIFGLVPETKLEKACTLLGSKKGILTLSWCFQSRCDTLSTHVLN